MVFGGGAAPADAATQVLLADASLDVAAGTLAAARLDSLTTVSVQCFDRVRSNSDNLVFTADSAVLFVTAVAYRSL